MEIVIAASIFGVVWLLTTIVFVVMYKNKQTKPGEEKNIKPLLDNQKEQNLMLNNMLMQALKNSEIATQNTINNLTVVQKQEFDSISKRVDELTTRNEQRIEKLTSDVNHNLSNLRTENEKAL